VLAIFEILIIPGFEEARPERKAALGTLALFKQKQRRMAFIPPV